MISRYLAIGLFLLTATLAATPLLATQLSPAADQAKPAAATKEINFTLKITDQKTGFSLEAKKLAASGSNAFDVLRDLVRVKYKTFPKLGPFVTGLCGVDAPDGFFWALYVDGKFSDVGIGAIALTKDIAVEWKTQKIEK